MKIAVAISGICILGACSTTPGTSLMDFCGETVTTERNWEILRSEDQLAGALFSVRGTSASDVWVVGATDKNKAEFGAQVLQWDGKVWTRFKTGAHGELWWIAPGTANGDWWMAGSEGQIVHRSADGTFTLMQAPDKTQLFGIHVVKDNDVYAVGGTGSCSGGLTCGVIWHYDGKNWSEAKGLDDKLRTESSWFKVWGRGEEVWVVGSGGHIIRGKNGVWTEEITGVDDQIFTISGNASLRVAVGGGASGVLLEDSGSGWKPGKINGKNLPGLRGVFVPESGRPVAVGINGAVWVRCGDTWTADARPRDSLSALDDLHATWTSTQGEVFAVGGDLNAYKFGELLRFGEKSPGSNLFP